MMGIFCKPEGLEEALRSEGFYSDILQGVIDPLSSDRNQDVFDEIMESGKSENEKLNNLLEKGFIFEREYNLLKRDISNEDTIPRKILVSYPRRFLDKLSVGPITLQEGMYAFCDDKNVLKEYEIQRVVGSFDDEEGLLNLVRSKMNKREYGLVLKNIGRKNGKNIS